MIFKSKIGWWFHTLVVLLGALTITLVYLAIVEQAIVLYVAPALSLDRVQLRYHSKDGDSNFMVVSPKDKFVFIEELKRRMAAGAVIVGPVAP